jgi:creatinine amidohydrolase
MVLPAIPFGVNTGQLDIPFTINFNPSTQFEILKDIVQSLKCYNINKLVILNSHGGNDFKQMIREFQGCDPDFFITQVNWFKIEPETVFFEDKGDHASELETCIMQVMEPDLVLPLSEAGDGSHKKYKFTAIKEGWAWAPREWTKVTNDTGIGNPAKSTPEKGKAYIDETVAKIGNYLIELGNCKFGDWYI